MTKPETTNAITMLKADHQKVKGLFDQFEKAKDFRSKKKFAQDAIKELKVHATLEEEIFYPSVRKEIDDMPLMNEANEEHHVAKVLIAELDDMKGDNDVYEAKFTVLAENVRHHIKEEEGMMFPEIKKTDIDLELLGQKMSQRKEELISEGTPPTAEESLIKCAHSRNDSPAKKEPVEANV
jgi:hemerythrin superfamily protein